VQLASGRRAAADITVQCIVVQERSHLGRVISSQRLQGQTRRLDHVGRGPLRLDQHPPTLSRISARKLTAGWVRASHPCPDLSWACARQLASGGGHQLIGRCRLLKGLDEDAEAAERDSNALFPLRIAKEDDGFAAEEGERDEVGEVGGRERAQRAQPVAASLATWSSRSIQAWRRRSTSAATMGLDQPAAIISWRTRT
jgi:hypothetical protein